MESNKIVYTAFTKFAVAIAVSQGATLKQAKAIIINSFDRHPYAKQLSKIIKKVKLEKENLNILSAQCISICEDFGPDRDYITLVLLLESIYKNEVFIDIEKDTIANLINKFKAEINRINTNIPPPPLFNVLLETRSVVEWTSMFWLYPFIPKHKSKKSKPVLLMPPYLGNDASTTFVRKYLRSSGFKTYKWELGVNMINSKSLPKLIEKLDEIYEKHQEKVSLVGWSGGGIFAKIIANRYPEKVEQLITIGSPVWGVKNMKTPIIKTLEFLRGTKIKERNLKFINELEEIPNLPITCIYTKTDGLIPWKNCMEAETYRNDIKNVEVFGSHCGMGANATVLLTVANALNANIETVKSKTIIEKFETLFFPKFWEQKGASKFTNLFFN
ncbi:MULTISPECIES: alpha/beta fold hydrolase [unclassified Polaribacter]|uniref:alpha/beta fold hydrolase n=1 Tax=unclassified Polaribacter TaxID=196858 RepID=UPI0011BFC13C|nr:MULTISPECIES: alpha/beta hydrolase [unclassified Polaribacter]TXD51250.1 alpha/beta hydrolase [Polaribacter sp. IC063]TXD58222.1 alpha/beta hydrolase [Polaribacter sp. IC066]